MTTTEIRAWIDNIQSTLNLLEDLGCTFKGSYSFKDLIYHPKNSQYNLDLEFMRLRIYKKTNWDQKLVQLIHKMKIDKNQLGAPLLKREFDTVVEAEAFLNLTHNFAFSASREGWQYEINNTLIFVENIEYLNPSIEVIAPNKEDVMSLLKCVNHKGIIPDSIPKSIALRLQMDSIKS